MEFTLRVARERGRLGSTFATAEERATPGYDEAYRQGQLDTLIADAAEAVETVGEDELELYALRWDIAAGPFRDS